LIRIDKKLDPSICSHKPEHLLAWHAYNCITDKKDWLCIVCCCCNTILKGSNEEFERYLKAGKEVLK